MKQLKILVKNMNKFRDTVFEESKAKGFHTKPADAAKQTANIHGEVSEFWEAYRKNKLNKPCSKSKKMTQLGLVPLTCAEEEVADIILRGFDLAADFKIDVEKAIYNKILFNRSRPHRNGGKLA